MGLALGRVWGEGEGGLGLTPDVTGQESTPRVQLVLGGGGEGLTGGCLQLVRRCRGAPLREPGSPRRWFRVYGLPRATHESQRLVR